jgi:redox-sensitive bicupin YhaK (pirin superfamily)
MSAQIHTFAREFVGDLLTFSSMSVTRIDQLDPFLLLNHHGPQRYKPNNTGMPFGPHPHRGIETVTFIVKGDVQHQDSTGGDSVIGAGGVQWMTAGRGIVHSENNSADFKQNGGELEVLQLWLNLHSTQKMCEPFYAGKNGDAIPKAEPKAGVRLQVTSGAWSGVEGAFSSKNDISLAVAELSADTTWDLAIPAEHRVLCYVIRGEVNVNGAQLRSCQLAEFPLEVTDLQLHAHQDSLLLLGHGKPFKERVVAAGPFVMNSEGQIRQAFLDYQTGKIR